MSFLQKFKPGELDTVLLSSPCLGSMANLVAMNIKRKDAEVASHGFTIFLDPKRIKLQVRQLAGDALLIAKILYMLVTFKRTSKL